MRKKILVRYSTIVLCFLIQTLFLVAIFRENRNSYFITIFIAALTLLTLYTYRRKAIHHHAHEFESLSVIVLVPLGAVCSYLLHHNAGLGPVLGASITGTLASLIPEFNKKSVYLKQIPPAIYCGAFVGMSDSRIASDLKFVLLAGFVTGVFLMVSKSILKGVGGKLGTLAFLGVLIATLFIYLLG